MGAYLQKPVTETFPSDDRNDKYAYGSSSMQGYRTSQEDAHMCLLDFDTDTCLFGVFDGHGGAEVAQYTSKKFPEILKNNESYKKQEYEKALKEAFIEFDASLVKDEVYKELKVLAGDMPSDEEEDDLKGNFADLMEEARMPISELLKKFTTRTAKEGAATAKDQCSPSSSKQEDKLEPCSSSKENGNLNEKQVESESSSKAEQVSSSEENETGCSSSSIADNVEDQPSSSNEPEAANKDTTQSDQQQEPSSTNQAESSSATEKPEKRRIKPTQVSSQVSFLQMLDEIDEEDSDDEDDSMEDEDDSDDNEMYDDSDESEEADESESEEEDDKDEDEDSDENKRIFSFQKKKFMFDEGPGKDSGCTAVIALLKDNKLYVANAGDSRAVLCRNGKAVEMSEDHKPTSEIEYARIKNAGGKVTQDGRVNGGLNLSRAFGDHSYKTNKDLPLDEQMITALPDVRTIDLQSEDEFIVIACDGIWNSMDSEEVVQYILSEMKKEKKLSKICDSLFFKCLADNTLGDGSGCDNQTCIIIKLKDLPEPEIDNGETKASEVEMNNANEEENDLNKVANNAKRKHEQIVNKTNSNGTDSIGESPSTKKTKSELD